MRPHAPVVIEAYDARWPARFRAEALRLRALFAPLAIRIEHVGSTAVPGLAAKPIIDLMLGAPLVEIDRMIPALEESGYQYAPEHERVFPQRRFLARPADRPREIHLHAIEVRTRFWDDHLRFRDFLRARPDVAGDYAAHKRELAVRFGSDREGYTEAKSDFVEGVLARAGRRGKESW